MKAIAIFLLFIGIILIIQAYYQNLAACPKPKTVIKYVPRSVYEEQLSDDKKLGEFYKNMFDGSTANLYTNNK
jgi:sulfur relay (sulfurtransferase) DsrC/TusE family protein